jgi:hypothetical protein
MNPSMQRAVLQQQPFGPKSRDRVLPVTAGFFEGNWTA